MVRYGAVPGVDLPMRKLAAIEALSSAGKANAAMLGSITIEPNLWPDSAVLDWWSILLRTASMFPTARAGSRGRADRALAA